MKKNNSVLAFLKPITSVGKKMDGPEVLKKVIDDLVPTVRQHPSIMKQFRQFIFASEYHLSKKQKKIIGLDLLRQQLEDLLPAAEKENIDLVFTTLEGMQLTIEEHHFRTNDELDAYAQEQKRIFKRKFLHVGEAVYPVKKIEGMTEDGNNCSDHVKPG